MSGMLTEILGLRSNRAIWLPLLGDDDGGAGGNNNSGTGGDADGDGEDIASLKAALAAARKDAKTSKTTIQQLQRELAATRETETSQLEQAQKGLRTERE